MFVWRHGFSPYHHHQHTQRPTTTAHMVNSNNCPQQPPTAPTTTIVATTQNCHITTMRLATSQARQSHVQRCGMSTNVLHHLTMMTQTAHKNSDDHNQLPPPTSDTQCPFTATGDDNHNDDPLPTSDNDHPATKTPHHRDPQNGDKQRSPSPTNHEPRHARTTTSQNSDTECTHG